MHVLSLVLFLFCSGALGRVLLPEYSQAIARAESSPATIDVDTRSEPEYEVRDVESNKLEARDVIWRTFAIKKGESIHLQSGVTLTADSLTFGYQGPAPKMSDNISRDLDSFGLQLGDQRGRASGEDRYLGAALHYYVKWSTSGSGAVSIVGVEWQTLLNSMFRAMHDHNAGEIEVKLKVNGNGTTVTITLSLN
ncbi:hypothetical protein F4776DRAFT_491671 [Hypoxylon sp. NC0597]|nr:hypothetical protein F4776DRAFT_491671 [Hypoxylon sp. NC0597]